MNEELYITLPSHSSRAEFPQNQTNHFKIRLPYPIRLQGSSWKVGLISISLPDVKVHLPKLIDGNEILFTMDWIDSPQGRIFFHVVSKAACLCAFSHLTHGATRGFSISHPFQSVGGGSFRVWEDSIYHQTFTEQPRFVSYNTLPDKLLLRGVASRVSTYERTGAQVS